MCSDNYRPKDHKKLYQKYISMKRRCYDDKHCHSYKYYGAVGIEVCPEWLGRGGFNRFMEDMYQSYFEGASLDRIDNALDYAPDNCRWILLDEQKANRRCWGNAKYKGVKKSSRSNNYTSSIDFKGERYNLGVFPTEEEAACVYDIAAKELRCEVSYFNGVECEVDFNLCSLQFHRLTKMKYYELGMRCLHSYMGSKPLMSSDGRGYGIVFPSRASVVKYGFDLRAVDRSLKGGSPHLNYKFYDLS